MKRRNDEVLLVMLSDQTTGFWALPNLEIPVRSVRQDSSLSTYWLPFHPLGLSDADLSILTPSLAGRSSSIPGRVSITCAFMLLFSTSA